MRSSGGYKLGMLVIVGLIAVGLCDYLVVAENCFDHTDSCVKCTEFKDCVYCGDEGYCVPGDPFGKSEPNQKCGSYRWMQCKIPGMWAIVICAGIVAVILALVLILVIWCCCCYKIRQNQKYGKRSQEAEVEEQLNLLEERRDALAARRERPTSHEVKRDEMKAKWGLTVDKPQRYN